MTHWKEIAGWFLPEECELLQKFAVNKDCLEIGAYKGRSTICLAEVAHTVLVVDTFKAEKDGRSQSNDYTTLIEYTRNTKSYQNILTCIGKSSEILCYIKPQSFDLILIDGDHSKIAVRDDIKISLKLLKGGGILALHDWRRFQVTEAANEFFDEMDGIEKGTAWKKID